MMAEKTKFSIRLHKTSQCHKKFGKIRGMKCQKRIAVAAERSSAYGRGFIRGVAEIAEQHTEWNLVLIDPQHAATKSSEGFDGWICRVADVRTAKALANCGSPVVDCLCAAPEPKFATVKTDAEAIGRIAAEHLIRHRFSNFAFCGYRRVAFSDRRRNAFATFLEKNGMRPSIYRPPLRRQNRFGSDFLLGDTVESPPDFKDLSNWLNRLPKPVGVFCCDDLRAFQLSMLCKSLGLATPDDIAILGVDDDPVYCMFSTPRLSSIDPDATAIGRTAFLTLLQMMTTARKASSAPQLTIPPRGIVERESTNIYPNAPRWFADAVSFIHRNAVKGISASDVFKHIGFSRTLVEQVFRKNSSSSVQKMIAKTRLNEAKRLLDTTSLPVKEVASLSGFSTLEYLSRAFAAETGLSPSAWRERNIRHV